MRSVQFVFRLKFYCTKRTNGRKRLHKIDRKQSGKSFHYTKIISFHCELAMSFRVGLWSCLTTVKWPQFTVFTYFQCNINEDTLVGHQSNELFLFHFFFSCFSFSSWLMLIRFRSKCSSFSSVCVCVPYE